MNVSQKYSRKRSRLNFSVENDECIYWKDQEDGFPGYCLHPEARPGEPCILNDADYCRLRDPPMVKVAASFHKCVICGNTMSSDEYEVTAAFSVVPMPGLWSARSLMMCPTGSEEDPGLCIS